MKERRFTYVLLHDRYFVLTELTEAVRAQLGDDLEYLLDGRRVYTAKRLCGSRFWDLLSLTERKLVGSCISHLTAKGELPLLRVNEFKKYPNKYVLKADPSTPGGARNQVDEHKRISA